MRDSNGTFLTSDTENPTIIGTSSFLAGDLDHDGDVDQLDIIQLSIMADIGGHYLAGGPSNWWQGDFTGDGQFNGADLSAALANYDP